MNEQIYEHPDKLTFIQSRAETNHKLIEEYSAMMKDGVQFDAAEGIRDAKGQIFIWDGRHRGEAAKLAGALLPVKVQSGTQHDAEWQALSANQKHGLRRSKADEEWIARTALLKFPDRSIREIHRHTGLNRRKISRIRDELIVSGAIAPDNKVKVTRDGVTYEQDTTNIGGTTPAYAPIWKLETAIRQWLGETSKDPARQLRALAEIKANTPEGQQLLSRLLSPDSLPSPRRKRDVIQACHNVLDQLRTQTQPFSATLQSSAEVGAYEVREFKPANKKDITSSVEPNLQSQEFKCPRCGQEKIVGVNGSRRWCLNCGAEWPTAAEFLAEINASQDEIGPGPTRTGLQQRFSNILAGLDEQDSHLMQVEIWLEELERQLGLATDLQPTAESLVPGPSVHSIPILEYA